MKKLFYFSLLSISLFSCGSEKKEESSEKEKPKEAIDSVVVGINLKDLAFMEGTWVDASGTMPGFHEKWIPSGDSLIQVIGYFVLDQDDYDPETKKIKHKKGDTLIMEAIKVRMIHENLHYIPKIEGQNNGAEIPYELGTGSTKDSLIFFNQGHDFPQIINYVKKSNDSILVYLSGIGEDKKPMDYLLQLKKMK